VYAMFTHESESARDLYFQQYSLIENERLRKVTCCHLQCVCGNMSETVQDRDVVTTDH